MSLPSYQTLALERREEHLLIVTLNRPQVLNALNTQMGKDKHDLWTVSYTHLTLPTTPYV